MENRVTTYKNVRCVQKERGIFLTLEDSAEKSTQACRHVRGYA